MINNRSQEQRKDQRQLTGKQGEGLAEQYLIQQGYVIVERNWRCRSGELDIIVRKDQLLIIVEVRTRKSLLHYGHPIESVERRKQQQVRKTSEVYVTMTNQTKCQIRFDVITVILTREGALLDINHITNAF
jgi:putative endonuclease